MQSFTFPKQMRLKRRKWIARLFESGESLAQYPLRMLWLELAEAGEAEAPVQIAFTVPKRQFRKAVDRNRMKRLMREAYRLRQHRWEFENRNFLLLFIYTGKQELPYQEVENALRGLLARASKKLKKG